MYSNLFLDNFHWVCCKSKARALSSTSPWAHSGLEPGAHVPRRDPGPAMHAAARGVTLYRTLNFTDNATAYDVGAIPAQNLASKKEVKTIRVADLLGQRPAGWNASTLSGSRFPDRPMMRTLSEYDAHKRADYNFRAEQLDCTATTRYIPRMSKMQANERLLDKPRLQQPHAISRVEIPVHSALQGKPRWDPSIGAGGAAGDQWAADKANAVILERGRVEALEYSKRHPPKHRDETLVEREARFMQEKREAKLAARMASAPMGSSFSLAETLPAGSVASMSFGRYGATEPVASEALLDDIRAHKVPVKRTTTWSLGSL